MSARFIEIHTLTSYAASLLNRDDAGFAKRIPFGGIVRTRVSSQCLKRHWRMHDGEHALKSVGPADSVRSRVSFEKFVVEPLLASGIPADVARAAAQKVLGQLLGGDEKKEKQQAAKKGKKGEAPAAASEPAEVKTKQVTVLGRPELEYLCSIARDACAAGGNDIEKVEAEVAKRMSEKNLAENLRALKPGSLEAGLSAALFGRMVTGDKLARVDAAIHVAHAFTVHSQQTESDYFSAIDDLIRDEGEAESGHINASELTTGLFYGYVVIDVDLLVSNLGGDRQLAAEVVDRLIHTVATVSPGAKLGATAPYANSQMVMVEAGKQQPRTLANAFVDAVRVTGAHPNMLANAYAKIDEFFADEAQMYGQHAPNKVAAMHVGDAKFASERVSLANAAAWAKGRVLE